MLCIGGIGDFISQAFLFIFNTIIDYVVYSLLAMMYTVWELLAKIDIFGGSSGGEVIYETFTQRIFTVIAIVMVFIFAYRLLCYIMDPDGKGKGTSSSTFIKNIVTSIIMVILAPIVFKYMAVFQYHVVANNTIPSIVLGTNGGNEVIPPGKQLSMITMMSFYYPEGYNYSSFVTDPNATNCNDMITSNYAGKAAGEWGSLMMDWCTEQNSSPGEFTGSENLHSLVGEEEGVVYMWIICSVAGVAVLYFLFQYCMAVGTRAARLAFLQIIAPIPILLRIFDKAGYFDPWFKEIKKTYLELFLRIAIISFVVFLCTLVPSIINMIFTAASGGAVQTTFFLQAIISIIMIVGMLNFAKEAPALIKQLFSAAGGMFAGVDLNPRGQFQRQSKPLMKAVGAGAGALGGLVGGGIRAAKNANADFAAVGGTKNWARRLHSIGAAIGGGARGFAHGGAAGFRNQNGYRDTLRSAMSGTDAGVASSQQASQRYRQGGSPNGFVRMFKRTGNRLGEFGDSIGDAATDWWEAASGNRTGQAAAEMYKAANENNSHAINAAGAEKDMERLKAAADAAKKKVEEKFMKGEYDADPDQYTKDLKAISDNLKSAQNALLKSKLAAVSDGTRDIISKYNEQTINNFEQNVNQLNDADLTNVLQKLVGSAGLIGDTTLSSLIDTDPTTGEYRGLTTAAKADLNDTLNKVLTAMKNNNNTANLASNGGDFMNTMDTLKSALEGVNNDIAARQAFEEHQRNQRQSGNNTNNSSSGGTGGSGGGS